MLAPNCMGQSTPERRASLQDAGELERFIYLLQRERVRSYLEIGARYGGTFEAIMMALPEGSCGLAVDFPGGPFGRNESVPDMLAVIDRINKSGRQASCIFGPSAAPEVYERVIEEAFFDAVLIDADHSYLAVSKDFRLYHPYARIIALHDIYGDGETDRDENQIEVPRLWRQLKADYYYHDCIEIASPGSKFGIGVMIKSK